jgi:hypothetical protein
MDLTPPVGCILATALPLGEAEIEREVLSMRMRENTEFKLPINLARTNHQYG